MVYRLEATDLRFTVSRLQTEQKSYTGVVSRAAPPSLVMSFFNMFGDTAHLLEHKRGGYII